MSVLPPKTPRAEGWSASPPFASPPSPVASARQRSSGRRSRAGSQPLPGRTWFLIALIVAAGGATAVFPKVGIVLVIAFLIGLWIARTIREPMIGILGAFSFYPLCALLRATYGAYHLPIWGSGVRLFPDLALTLTFLALLMRASKNRERFRFYSDDVPVLIYLLSGVYGFGLGASYLPIYGPLNGWWVSMTPAVFYVAMRFLRPTEADARRFVRFFLISFALLAAGSFYQYVIRPQFIINLSQAERPYFPAMTSFAPDIYWRVYMRMESLLFEENVWGTLCTFVALYMLTGLQGFKTPAKHIVLLLLALAGIGFSMSRGAIVTFVIGVGVLLLLRGRHRGRILASLAAFAVVGAVIMIRWGGSDNMNAWLTRVNTLTSTDSKNNASSDRVHQWKAGWDIFVHNPSGTGLGTAGYAAHLSGIGQHVVADGIYFRILAEQGVPGLLMTVMALFGAGWVLFRHVFGYSCKPYTRRLGMTLFAFHCGFVIQSIGANTYDLWYVPSLFWAMFGLFVARCEQEQREIAARAAPAP